MKIDSRRLMTASRIEKVWPPPVAYKRETMYKTKKSKKKEEDSDEEDSKEKYREFEVPLNRDQPDGGTYKRKVRVFAKGTAEDWIRHRMEVEDLLQAGNFQSKVDVWRTLFDDKYKDIFRYYFNQRTVENNDLDEEEQLGDDDLLNVILNDVTKKVFGNEWSSSVRVQKGYLRKNLRMEGNPEVFFDRLKELNEFLPYFPVPFENGTIVGPQVLPDDEIMDIVDAAKPEDWHITMLSQGKRPDLFDDPESLVDYLKQLWQAEKLHKSLKGNTGSESKKRGGDNPKNDAPTPKRTRTDKRTQKCVHCNGWHVAPDAKCWKNPANKEKSNHAEKKEEKKLKKQFQQFSNFMKQQEKAKAAKKRKAPKDDDDSTTESTLNNHFARMRCADDDSVASIISNDEVSYEQCHALRDAQRPTKKTKLTHFSPEIVVEIEDRNGDLVPIRALLDTGTTASILLRDFVRKGRAKSYSGKKTIWATMGGEFQTKRKALVDFKLPELCTQKKITHIVHVDERTKKEHSQYDMIIGMDIMTTLGIDIKTSTKEIEWEGAKIPLRPRGGSNKETLNAIYEATQVPEPVAEAEERQARILDADYSAVDVMEYINELKHLNKEEKSLLLRVLQSHPKLLQGGLGTLNVRPIHLEIQPGATPYHARPFPVPKSLEATTKKEMERLTGIKVFKKDNDSEWAAPTFVQPKKTGDVRILTDFRKLNAVLKRKPFPLPKISDILQKLSGFKYATAIDLSMGYYHIPLDEASQKLCTTILPWGKIPISKVAYGDYE